MSTTELDIHAASEAERLDAFRNVHEFWGRGLSLDDHMVRRLASPQHNRAEWFVGCVDGKVVSSLGCYAMEFRLRDNTVPGIAIGSVHTLPDYRGHGYASQLLQWVEQNQRQHGARISMLYSDIDPAYYERAGYAVCRALEGWHDVSPHDTTLTESDTSLVPFELSQHLDEAAQLYETYHREFVISVTRNVAYWEYLCRKETDDELFWLQNDTRFGYVRICIDDDELRIRDLALVDHSDQLLNMLLSALIDEARLRQVSRVGGWLPDLPPIRKRFILQPRTDEITMLKSLDTDLTLGDEELTAAQHFCEIDHV